MYLRFLFVTFIVFLPAILNGCRADSSNNISKSCVFNRNKKFTPSSFLDHHQHLGKPWCDQSFADLDDPDSNIAGNAIKTIVVNAQKDTVSYDNVSTYLINELRRSCIYDAILSQEQTLASESDFHRIRNIGEILAQLKNPDAIPILIDCSDRRTPDGGLSSNYYPAIDPLLRFGDSAIPFLLEKYDYEDSERKCRIASILTLLGSPRSFQSLTDLLSTEKDVKVRKCLVSLLQSPPNKALK